jgi:ethanolamine ammonia-lyase large subunit
MYKVTLSHKTYDFQNLKNLLAKASPYRSGDELAGVSAESEEERVAAKLVLADIPLTQFLKEELIPYDEDEVTRLIFDTHDKDSFKIISSFTVGEFREWLLSEKTTNTKIKKIQKGLTPEMVSAVSKLMRISDLISVAKKIEIITRFRNTIGLKNRLSVRLQPNHPTDDVKGILASTLDGLLYGAGDAVIGINPVTENFEKLYDLVNALNLIIETYQIPTQSCVLSHITTGIDLINKQAPVDLLFQSIGGTEGTNSGFGINLKILKEGYEAALSLKRGSLGQNVMYFETGQGSSLSAEANQGVDQQTCEVRAYAVAREFSPLLVNTVVGFIGPEYLYDGKQIIRAGLEDHFCGKLMGLPMGCDICYTNHAEADGDDTDTLLTLLGAAGCTYIMGIPGADDIMLNYQSTSFHDAIYIRSILGLKPAPEFEAWLNKMKLTKKGLPIGKKENLWNKKIETLLPITGNS